MKAVLTICAAAVLVAACAGAPPRRHVYWDRPHSTIPSWFPPEITWIQKVYYTLVSHFGSAVAAGFGTFFGPLGPFVSSFSQPYFSTYVSRLTDDVVARSLSDSSAPLDLQDNSLASHDQVQRYQPNRHVKAAPFNNVLPSADLSDEELTKDKTVISLLKDTSIDDYFKHRLMTIHDEPSSEEDKPSHRNVETVANKH